MIMRLKRKTLVHAAGAGVLTASLLGAAMAAASASPAYDDSIQLSWDGSTYAATTTESFVGTPVAVPGDQATRTLVVRNDGPTEGVLHAVITNVELLDPDSEDVHYNPNHQAPDESGYYSGAGHQGDFYDDLTVSWSTGEASMTHLDASETTEILTTDLAPGEETEVSIGYEFPIEATSGNTANVDPRSASFDVILTLGGEIPEEPEPTPTEPEEPTTPTAPPPETSEPEPTPSPEPDAPGDPAAAEQPRDSLPVTGANVMWPALVGALLAFSGLILHRAFRNRPRYEGM
ncbi:LPXTG cell wall anchor domain-containing protein [Nesterenkonia muleiensis]|uniref:LPXTG cell wall anchor domain-containing protein n=1 Tax=Nesterenkonia muleiensis TaxID=2282648 RepID=UPI000E7207CE|nr:LPXTG cell wall anchor domain-containing protein [Nesterenkonia muleiensis]